MGSADDDPTPAPEPSRRSLAARPHDKRPDEPRRERLLRHLRRVRLYSSATAVVVLLVVLVLLISVNARTVKIDWLVGSTRASLIWIVLAATVLGWLLGIATNIAFRHHTRRRQL